MSIYPSSNPNREGRLPQAAMANISDQENIMHSLNVIINEASPGSGTEAIAINHKCNQEDSDTTIESGKVLEPGPNLQQAKVSLRFKHSTKWLPSMKKKNSQADITQAIKDQASLGKANENETSNLPSNPRPEQKNRRSIISSKRISLTPSAFFPKRFSSLYPSNPANTLEMSMETTKLSKGPSKTPNEEVTSHVNRSPIISQKQPPVAPLSPNNSIDNPNDLSPSSPSLSPQPLFCYSSLDKNASFCSSTPSEKSTIGKSLNVFRKTTKSILFLDPNSNGSTAETFETSSHADNQLKDESLADNEDEQIEDMPLLRRSISYTDADRRNIIAYINNSNGDSRRASNYTKNIPNFNPMHITDSRIQSPCNNSSPSMKNNTSYGISDLRGFGSANGNDINNTRISNRQRSRTMDTSENPLLELASGNNSGILSSIANFVKINRASSSASLRTPPESQTQPKLSHLELVANETPSEFLQRILKLYPLTCICEVLSLENNEFSQQTLQEYLKKYYNFEDEPLDISLRKFLMLNYLPKETQQIDRVIYQFAKHYKACNPQLGFDDDTVYILTYSLIMVHTDKFNPNNKRKMTRFDFIKNVLNAIESNKSSSNFKIMNDLIMKELLGYFYDNITYCPLIKITPEQNDYALEALESNDLQYPYPHMTFLNGSFSSSSFKDYDYRKGSISSTLSIPSSSSSIVRSNSQQLLQTQPPSKKKSSSFLWSGSSMLDPYDYIVQNDPLKLDKLKLFNLEKGNIKPNCDIPFLSTINLPQLKCDVPSIDMIHEQLTYYGEQIKTDIDTVLLNNIWKTLTEKRVSFTLKIPKSKGSYLVSSKTNVVELNSSKGDEFYLTRVFKVGIINRQEITKTPNSVSSLVPVPKPDVTDMPEIGDADKENLNRKLQSIVWKPYFCILTAVGMFFYEDVASFRMRFCGVDPDNGTNTVIIEEASSKGKEMVNTKLNDPRTVIGGSTDNTGFMSFPYFKSEKNDKTDRLEKDLLTVVTTPNFTLGSDCVATRKMQNLEYDEIVNKGKLSNVSESVVTTNLCEVSSSSSEKKTSLNDKRTSNESPLQEPEKRKSRDSAKVKSRNYTFFIYGRNSKNMYMVSSLDELRSWIQSINIISTLNDVIIDYESLDYMIIPDEANGKTSAVEPSKFYEIVPRRVLTIKEKLAGYRKEKFQRESDKEVSDNITSMGDKNAATRFRDRRNTTFSGKKASSKYENLSQTAYKIDEESGLDFTLNSNTCSQTHSSNSTQTSEYETASIDLSKDENDSRIPTDSDISLGSIETTSNQATSSLSTKSDDLHDDSHTELLEHLYSIKNLTTTMPLQKKTEEELLSTAKFLSIKLEWLWYDECKTEIITVIADLMMELF